MHRRAIVRVRPALERLEEKQLPSVAALPAHVVHHAQVGAAAGAIRAADRSSDLGVGGEARENHSPRLAAADQAQPPALPTGFFGFRLTNPTLHIKVKLTPPFGQVLVQSRQPAPGHVYNILSVVVRNGTAQTFTASNGFTVKFPNRSPNKSLPILTGTQVWKPNHWIVFYVLTKKYYPLKSQISGGFQFNLGGKSTTLIPGPSGIFLRLTYSPATFARTLDWIIAYGQGAQLGNGPPFGIPDTQINQIVAARNQKIDYGGRF